MQKIRCLAAKSTPHEWLSENKNTLVNHLLYFWQEDTEIFVETKRPTLQGVAFPLQENAVQALEKLQHKELSYVQLVSICVNGLLNFFKSTCCSLWK